MSDDELRVRTMEVFAEMRRRAMLDMESADVVCSKCHTKREVKRKWPKSPK